MQDVQRAAIFRGSEPNPRGGDLRPYIFFMALVQARLNSSFVINGLFCEAEQRLCAVHSQRLQARKSRSPSRASTTMIGRCRA
jgi:hypothetical protein